MHAGATSTGVKMKRLLLLSLLLSGRLLAQPVITTQPTNQIVYGGSNVVFSVAVSGTGPFTYQWQCNGTNLPNAIITTVAGNGNEGYSGDGGLADQSSISGSFGIVVDGAGNVFISDFNNSRVRKVDTNGIISTVAGNGTNGFSGDGGAATNASLANPSGLALDAVGNLFIADYGNNYVRKLDTNGIITTVAGNGLGTYSGDGGAATNASLFNPFGLAFDSVGNLYIADSDNNVIRKVDTSGVITTVPGYYPVYPAGVALDASGNLYVADCNSLAVEKVDTNGIVTTIYSIISWPRGVAVDAAGNVYIAAFYDNRVQVLDTNGIINTVAGNGITGYSGDNGDAMNASFNSLNALAMDNHGNIFVSDFYNNRVRAVTYSGPTLKFSNVTTNLSGAYSVVVSTASGSVTSSVATLNVVLPPSIATEPISQQILVASNVTFSVSAYGTSPMNYQWQFNGTNINEATNNAFMIGMVETNDAGNYTVTITNDYGSVTSSIATLTVLVIPPGIDSQPTSQTVPAGSNAMFSVVVSGSPPLNYQWLFNGASSDGQTNSSLSLPSVTTNQAGAYSVWVNSPYGSITSHVATLTVGWLPTITSQPTNQTLLAGGRAFVVAGVSGVGPLTFQWQLNGTNLTNNLITTIAGNGTNGFAGDGGMATTGKVSAPYGVVADNAGNVFIADTANNRIRKVDANGVITTVTGSGSVPGFSGDGGAATSARLNSCYGVALDGMGNLFIADSGNNRIRKVDANGIISTVAGGGASFGDGGAATNAQLHNPYGVAVDTNGNLFIADTYNNRIRKVDINGVITTVAGKSSAGFSGDGGMATNASLYYPQSVALDGAGNLFIADYYSFRVRKVDAYGTITTIAGNGTVNGFPSSHDGGPATNAPMNPTGVFVDGYGDVLIADSGNYYALPNGGNNRIRQVDPYGIITTVAGTARSVGYTGDGVVATSAPLYKPSGVAMDSYGRVLIADTRNNRIRRFGQGPTLVLDKLTAANAGDYTLVINSSYGSVTSVVATLTVLLPPSIIIPPASQTIGLGSNAAFGVTVTGTEPMAYQWQLNGTNLADQTGQFLSLTNVQWSDAGNYAVIITNNYGSVTSSVVTLTVVWPPAITNQPASLTVLEGSNVVLNVGVSGTGPFSYQWQLNSTNLPDGIITTIVGNGASGYSGDGGNATNANINPRCSVLDNYGNLYIADRNSHRVRKVSTNGIISTFAGNGAANFSGDGGAATNGSLKCPTDVAIDAFGNLFIADSYNNRIRKVDTNGLISTVAGNSTYGYSGDGGAATNASLYTPQVVAVDAFGNLFIADIDNNRIRKVGANGIITTVAGGGTSYPGDGGAATNAQLYDPLGMAVDVAGNLFFADTFHNRIRKVGTNGIITTIAGNGTNGYSGDGGAAINAELYFPLGLAVDASGNLFIADTSNYRIRRVDANGIITTVTGNGTFGYSGDGGAATNARLSSCYDVAVDGMGNLFIADTENNRIRKVTNNRVPALVLNNVTVTNAGNYQVLVTGPGGFVTSSQATLTVIVPPNILAFTVTNGTFNFTWNAQSNFAYQLQYATNLVAPVWQNLGSPITATNGSVSTVDIPGMDTQRFYRVQLEQ